MQLRCCALRTHRQYCSVTTAPLRSGAYGHTSNKDVRHSLLLRAESSGSGYGGGDGRSSMPNYIEARIDSVRQLESLGPAIMLRFGDGQQFSMPIYVGVFEYESLSNELYKKRPVRPLTHDLFRNAVELLGYKVTKMRLTALVGNTYHARIHLTSRDGTREVDLDARPSDALNMAIRFGAPIYINRDVAEKMGIKVAEEVVAQPADFSTSSIEQSCRDEIVQRPDPTVMLRLQLQLAVQDEDFETAASIRNEIERILSTDRGLGLAVAIETALADQRYEEAAQLRSELHRLRQEPST